MVKSIALGHLGNPVFKEFESPFDPELDYVAVYTDYDDEYPLYVWNLLEPTIEEVKLPMKPDNLAKAYNHLFCVSKRRFKSFFEYLPFNTLILFGYAGNIELIAAINGIMRMIPKDTYTVGIFVKPYHKEGNEKAEYINQCYEDFKLNYFNEYFSIDVLSIFLKLSLQEQRNSAYKKIVSSTLEKTYNEYLSNGTIKKRDNIETYTNPDKPGKKLMFFQ